MNYFSIHKYKSNIYAIMKAIFYKKNIPVFNSNSLWNLIFYDGNLKPLLF